MASKTRATRRAKVCAAAAAAVAVSNMASPWIGTANASVPSADGKIYGCYGRAGDLHVFFKGHRPANCPPGFKTMSETNERSIFTESIGSFDR